jgi:BolA protein
MTLADRIRQDLQRAFAPTYLRVEDESARHAGHPGAAGGGGHLRVLIVSAAFHDADPVSRQRAVYRALGDAMGTTVHALALQTLTPEEWDERVRGPGA